MVSMNCCLGNGTDSNSFTKESSSVGWSKILIGVFLYALVFITIAGNILVLMAVYTERRLQTIFNYYIVNLAITDVLVAVTAMSFYTTSYVLGYWPFGNVMCGIWIFFDYGMTFVSVFTLVLISVDRFWSVTWCVHYRRYHNKGRCLMSIGAVWLFMLLLWLPPCIVDRILHSVSGECIWEPSMNKPFVVLIAIFGHHGSCVGMLFCYIRVLMAMRRLKKVGHADLARDTRMSHDENTTEISTISRSVRLNANVQSGLGDEHAQDHTLTCCQNARPQNDLVKPPVCTPNSTNRLQVPNAHTSCQCTEHTQPKTLTYHQSEVHTTRRQRRDKNIFITLTYIIVAYVICWVPFHFVFDISCINPLLVPEEVYSLTFYLTYINSTINPILYACSCSEFRAVFNRILRRRL